MLTLLASQGACIVWDGGRSVYEPMYGWSHALLTPPGMFSSDKRSSNNNQLHDILCSTKDSAFWGQFRVSFSSLGPTCPWCAPLPPARSLPAKAGSCLISYFCILFVHFRGIAAASKCDTNPPENRVAEQQMEIQHSRRR